MNRTSFVSPSRSCITPAVAAILLLELVVTHSHLRAQTGQQPPSAPEAVQQMVRAEAAAWRNRPRCMYRKQERSNRTRGHLWEELVVETPDGSMERLISIDGQPLSNDQKETEERRIAYLANHPGRFRRQTQRRNEDEARMPSLLAELPSIFLFQNLGSQGEYTRIGFAPNPSFQEKNYQDRVVHALAGVLLIHTLDMRLARLDAHLEHKVDFGFGLLGEVRDTTNFSLDRNEVIPGYWEPTKLHVHLDGTILLMKSISRDVEASQSRFRLVPQNLTVAQAAALVRSSYP